MKILLLCAVMVAMLVEIRSLSPGMAYPHYFYLRQQDGNMTPILALHGGSDVHFMVDTDGYTIAQDDNVNSVYAITNQAASDIVESDLMVGRDDPLLNPELLLLRENAPTSYSAGVAAVSADTGIANMTRPMGVNANSRHNGRSHPHRRQRQQSQVPPLLKNLVILVRFADHKDQARRLPSPSAVDILFNKNGSTSRYAPTGSVRDVFATNSYGSFALKSTIYGWIDLAETEAYYAGGSSGLNSDKFVEVLHEAVRSVQQIPTFKLEEFDADGDGFVDVVTVLHSGYAAEFPGNDASGAPPSRRIWSHHTPLSTSYQWRSNSTVSGQPVVVDQFATVSALWGLSGSIIGRIGMIAHEIGHCLGLPDMYGTPVGNGIGAFDFMSSSWGFGPHAFYQLYPPSLSAWSKFQLGWITPTLISSSGLYTLVASAESNEAYQINLNDDCTEFLLIENRQPIGFDKYIPHGGLAIWHIDNFASNIEGYPGQAEWPENGNQYKIALLQADGKYNLERGDNFGDATDLFHAAGTDNLQPRTSLSDGPYPSTSAHEGNAASALDMSISISDISPSGTTMTFRVEMRSDESSQPPSQIPTTGPSISPSGVPTQGPTLSPTPSPTRSPTPSPTEWQTTNLPSTRPSAVPTILPTLTPSMMLSARQITATRYLGTHFGGGNGAFGNMFDVMARTEVKITGIQVHTSAIGSVQLEVWIKDGSHVLHDRNPSAWRRIDAQVIDGKGRNRATAVDVQPITLEADSLTAFYITTVEQAGLRYTNGGGIGLVAASNPDLTIYEGVGKRGPFGYSFPSRVWNGVFQYEVMAKQDGNGDDGMGTAGKTSRSTGMHAITTTFAGGTGQDGNMFDVMASDDITIVAFDVHLVSTNNVVTVEVMTKAGGFSGHEENCDAWDLVSSTNVTAAGFGERTFVNLDGARHIILRTNQTVGFYVTVRHGALMQYTPQRALNTTTIDDDHVSIRPGVGKSYPCGATFNDRVWNGGIHYVVNE